MATGKRAGSTTAAGVLILLVTAFFTAAGVELAREAIDPSRLAESTYLTAVGFGLNPDENANLTGIMAVIVLVLCGLTTSVGIGVLARRESVRHAGMGMFVVFTLITIPLAVAGLAATDESASGVGTDGYSPWFGLLIGLVDAAIVWLLLTRRTATDFERAESARQRAAMMRDRERPPGRLAGRGPA